METYRFIQTKKIILGLLGLFCIIFPRMSHAAMLSFFPTTGSFTEGKTFTVIVRASSYAVPLNAVSGTLSYPADLLSVVSVNKSGSLITNWLPPGADGPIYTPGSGTIRFEGIALAGYQGAPRTVFTVTFRVKKAGVASLKFSNGLILANDGEGSDITNALGSASYTLLEAPIEKPTVDPEPVLPLEPTPVAEPEPTPDPEPQSVIEPEATPVVSKKAFALFRDPYILYGGGAFLLLLICIIILSIRIHQLSQKIRRLEAGRRSLKKKILAQTKSSSVIPF
jgi:hypothetical protein